MSGFSIEDDDDDREIGEAVLRAMFLMNRNKGPTPVDAIMSEFDLVGSTHLITTDMEIAMLTNTTSKSLFIPVFTDMRLILDFKEFYEKTHAEEGRKPKEYGIAVIGDADGFLESINEIEPGTKKLLMVNVTIRDGGIFRYYVADPAHPRQIFPGEN